MRPSLERLQVRHWLLVGTLALATALWARPQAWGVVAGGAAIGVSTFLYAVGFHAMVRRQSRRLAFMVLFVKLALFAGLGWLLFSASKAYRPDPLGFAMGVSCLPVAAVWEAIRARKD